MNAEATPTPNGVGAPVKRFFCVACATHKRPDYVPWDQHAIGCILRQVAIAATSRESRVVPVVAAAAARIARGAS